MHMRLTSLSNTITPTSLTPLPATLCLTSPPYEELLVRMEASFFSQRLSLPRSSSRICSLVGGGGDVGGGVGRRSSESCWRGNLSKPLVKAGFDRLSAVIMCYSANAETQTTCSPSDTHSGSFSVCTNPVSRCDDDVWLTIPARQRPSMWVLLHQQQLLQSVCINQQGWLVYIRLAHAKMLKISTNYNGRGAFLFLLYILCICFMCRISLMHVLVIKHCAAVISETTTTTT